MNLNASNEVMRRRHQKTQSRLPPVYDPQNLFATPGAGPSNLPDANQFMTAGTGGPAQPREMAPLPLCADTAGSLFQPHGELNRIIGALGGS